MKTLARARSLSSNLPFTSVSCACNSTQHCVGGRAVRGLLLKRLCGTGHFRLQRALSPRRTSAQLSGISNGTWPARA
eukprot:4092447-Lingulodinium_polyedra.AAC.1